MTILAAVAVLLLMTQTVVADDHEEATEGESNVIIDVVLPLSLAFIMFSLGLGLTTSDFGLVFTEPKAFAIGITNQMLVLPIIGFSVATILGLSGEMAVGLMILACCPGGVTSNILTKLAKGDTALSISYTAVVSVVTVISLPLIIGFSMDHFMGEAAPEIDILSLGVTMFMLTALPVTVGMLMRRYSPERTDKIEPGASKLAAGLFVIIVIAAIVSEFDTLMDNLGTLGPAVIPLMVISVSTVNTDLTSSRMFFDSSAPDPMRSISKLFARSMTTSLLAETTFSILCTRIEALQGPIRSIVSRAATITEVET